MSRSGYSYECEQWDLIRWRGAVNSSIRGKRGQAMLRELLDALDALPEKRLAADSLVTEDGEVCALGALGRARGMDMTGIDPEDRESVAKAFGIAEALAAEVMYYNDGHIDEFKFIEVEICGPMRTNYPDWGRHKYSFEVPDEKAAEKRWSHMHSWVAEHLKPEQST